MWYPLHRPLPAIPYPLTRHIVPVNLKTDLPTTSGITPSLPAEPAIISFRMWEQYWRKTASSGLAHFLEHMAFNGTTRFPGKGILNTLERHGVAFGSNINAYTGLDETVYNLSDVPVDKPGLVDTCLMILADWSDYITLSDEEINKERGVIIEEWRSSTQRIQENAWSRCFRFFLRALSMLLEI